MTIKTWFKDNILAIGMLAVAVVIRFYYFSITKTQTLWWDEAAGMAVAKSWAGLFSYPLESIRMPAYPYMMSFFFKFGTVAEPVMRFIALYIPSLILIWLMYLVIKEMYEDKRVALISMSIMAVLWESLFYSNRFMTENPALIFEFAALYVLFKYYVKRQSNLSLIWVTLLSIISLLFRPGNIVFVPAIVIFVIYLSIIRWRKKE